MAATTSADLATALYAPNSIALVGASADPVKASSRPLKFLRESGYGGRIFPVNRKGGTLGGEAVYTSVSELPEVPEHAFIMTPTAAVLDTVIECGRVGVAVATILSGGFGETGPQGQVLQEKIAATAAEYGIRLLGPNSLGIVNTYNGLTLTANAAFAEPDVPRGGLFAASQSGSMIGSLVSRGIGRGIGFSRLVSVGAEIDLSIGELCAATLDDPEVTGYLLFLETIRHAEQLRRFASGAAERGKPVLAYKLGKSSMAAQLAASHTGALAGEDDVASAFFDDLGIVRVHTLEGLLEGAPLVAAVPPRPAGIGRRVGVVTTTGGGAAMVVDQLGVHGVEVVAPSPDTVARMSAAGADTEPGLIADLTLAGTRPEIMRAALDVLTSAPEFDLILAVAGSSARNAPELLVTPILECAAANSNGHPIAAFLVPEAPEALHRLTAAGVACFRTPEACADAIAGSLGRRPARAQVPSYTTGASELVDEARSYKILRSAGIEVAPFVVARIDDLLEGRVPDLDYPVVVKALSGELAHKSDVGGVVLGNTDREQVVDAARAIRQRVAQAADIDLDSVLIQHMIDAVGEMLVGYRIDPVTGPLVLVAAGGTLAEVYADRSVRMAPVDRATAVEMLNEIAAIEGLRGFRGGPRGDLDALIETVVEVSNLAQRPEIDEAEINPVLVREAGQGVVAVDAAVRIRSGHLGQTKGNNTPC